MKLCNWLATRHERAATRFSMINACLRRTAHIQPCPAALRCPWQPSALHPALRQVTERGLHRGSQERWVLVFARSVFTAVLLCRFPPKSGCMHACSFTQTIVGSSRFQQLSTHEWQCPDVLRSAFGQGLPSYASRDSMPNLCDRGVKCKGRLFNAALGETVVDAGCFVVSCVSYFRASD